MRNAEIAETVRLKFFIIDLIVLHIAGDVNRYLQHDVA